MLIKKFMPVWLLVFFAPAAFAQTSPCLDIMDDPQVCETREILYESSEAVVVQQKAAELGTPAGIYEYLRNNADYALYHGARSNSLNGFLSLRSNDVDLASTLIAMFRSQGIRARYVQGNIRITRDALANWLGVIDTDLAVSLLGDQGIQNIDASDPTYVSFEHVWVEALIQYSDYRGNSPNADSAACVTQNDTCRWIPLSPSFKQKRYQEIYRLLLQDLEFDYDAYYNAQNPSSPNYIPGLRNKSPLEILEEQALAYLRANNPGLTLEDVIDKGEIIADNSGILPSSLPFEVVGAVVRYNSVTEHDAAESIDWTKYLRTRMQVPNCGVDYSNVLPRVTIPVADLSTRKLTLTLFDQGGTTILGHRLDGQSIGTTFIVGGSINFGCDGFTYVVQPGSLINVELEVDIEPGSTPVEVTYNNLVVGGYYLVASGGETSNATQIQRAYEELLAANKQFTILVDQTGVLGPIGIPYVDDGDGILDSGDTPLADNLEAQDALTGGLLYVAQSLYYTRLREESARYSGLKGIVSPVSAFLGVVSTDDQVEYLDNVPFAVTPGGLLIDLKGIRLNGSWRMDEPETYSNEAFRFLGHIASSLEHEVWQEITGYDAISTLRGIQFAAEQGKPLLDIENNGPVNNFPNTLTDLGFTGAPPAGFSQNNYTDLFGRDLVAWSYSGGNPQESFEVFRRDLTGLNNTDNASILYTYSASNGINGFFSSYDATENQLQVAQQSEGQLKTNIQFNTSDSFYQTYDVLTAAVTSPGGFAVGSFTRTASNAYRYIINETSQHADGTYPVTIAIEAADSNNTVTSSISGLSGFSVLGVNAITPSGFTVNSFNQVNSDVWNVIWQQSSGHSNGNYTVTLRLTLLSGPTIFTADVPISVRIISNRFVDQAANLTTGGIDVSDDQSLSCSGGPNGELVQYTGSPSELLVDMENCFNNVIAVNNIEGFVDFFDRDLGFNPAAYAFRGTEGININQYDTAFVRQMQADLYFATGGYFEYLLPTRRPQETFYLFSVYLKNIYDTEDNLASSTYAIVNNSNMLFGGGYVSAEQPLVQAESDDFNNNVFTDTNVISVTNNDRVRTPSTSDPVSTVTGNMYHDETDITIKGRGLNYTFTRTYNSNQSTQDSPLGFGWSHSYGMSLRSNDYGANPNYDNAQAPENGNGISSSISYTDERGGAHLYILNGDSTGTRSVASNPPGEFDILQLNTPVAGQHTLLFRNGVRYVLEETGSALAINPDQTARLLYIEDSYNNRLTMSYDGSGRLSNIVDNLGVSGRTGLAFAYSGNRIDTISDWTGRVWDFNYSAEGDLIAMVNPLTDAMTYTYHSDSHLLNEIIYPADRNGQQRQMAFGYYENNQAYNYVNQLGEVESLSYDLFRKRTRITNPRGFRSEHYYDENGGLIKLVEKDKGISLFENNANGLRYRKLNALGFETQYSYQADRSISAAASDNFARVSREIDPLGNNSDIDYGMFDQPTTTIDKRGNPATRVYYSVTNAGSGAVAGKLQEVRTTLNSTANVLLESYTYYADTGHPAFGQVQQRTEYIDPVQPTRRRITNYVYDATGINVESQTVSGATSGGSIMTTYTYDALGRLETETLQRRTSATDPTLINLTTTYEYDDLGRVTRVTDPRSDIRETVYDDNGQVAEERVHYFTTTPRDNCAPPSDGYVVCTTVTNVYDAADRLVQTTEILGHRTTFEYDAVGNLIKQTDANGHVMRYEYDSMNRRTAAINANGHRSESTYDLAGRLVATKDPNGNVTRYEYDALGRRTRLVTPLGFETRFQYDANGNQTGILDANAIADSNHPRNSQGLSVFNEFDELNRIVSTLDAQNGDTLTTYDLLGNITSITDAEGQVTQFVYDDLGRLIETIDPVIESGSDQTDRVLLYDEAGNVLLTEDRTGRQKRHSYDVLNRRVQTEFLFDSSQQGFVYNDFDDLVQVSNDGVTYTYTYTSRHEMQSKMDSRDNKTLTWTYDPAGNVITKTDYQNEVTTFQYDSTNRLVAMRNPAYLQVNYHYDAAGRLLNRILSNGAQTNYRYDANNRLMRLENVSADETVVENLDYQRDATGNITQITDTVSGRTIDYDYDAMYWLTSVDSSQNAEDRSYTYDNVGNRLTLTENGTGYFYCYDATDCSTGPDGNRLRNIRTGSVTGPLYRQFQYDDAGRIVQKQDGTGTPIYTVTYNGKGRAGQINAGAQTSVFAYDVNDYRIRKDNRLYYLEGEHQEAVYNDSNELLDKYFRGVIVDEIVNGFTYNSTEPNDAINYTFHHDHINSVTALTGHTGDTEQTWTYDAFGQVLNTQAPGTDNELLYTGRNFDADTGLYYYRARYYDPEIGRFISEDPLGFEAGINFYVYCLNNPTICNDPSGKQQFFQGFAPIDQMQLARQQYPAEFSQAYAEMARQQLIAVPDFYVELNANAGAGFLSGVGASGGGRFIFGEEQSMPVALFNPAVEGTLNVSGASVSPIGLGAGLIFSDVSEFNNSTRYSLDTPIGGLSIFNNGSSITGFGLQTPSAGASMSSYGPETTLPSGSYQGSFDLFGTYNPGQAANGGFVLYPSKPNLNALQVVYSK